jgi:hypothetical protein
MKKKVMTRKIGEYFCLGFKRNVLSDNMKKHCYSCGNEFFVDGRISNSRRYKYCKKCYYKYLYNRIKTKRGW